MKRVISIAAVLPLIAFVAGAQTQDEVNAREKMLKAELEARQMKVQAIGAVKGMTVKNAPYSGEEVNETSQVLADGTRIHRETRAMVYRDSEGRTRRETPENITITDPVANVTYILNPKTMTGQKLSMAMAGYSFVRKESVNVGAGSGVATTFTMRMESDGGTPQITVNGESLDPKQVQKLMAEAKMNGDQVFVKGMPIDPHVMDEPKGTAVRIPLRKMAGESLGKQSIEGVNAEGMRNVNTIKAGTIGNDRDIQVTGESWYSAELQTTVMSKHSDPRSGEESFRLVGINRNEPGAYLFQPPAGYNISERK